MIKWLKSLFSHTNTINVNINIHVDGVLCINDSKQYGQDTKDSISIEPIDSHTSRTEGNDPRETEPILPDPEVFKKLGLPSVEFGRESQ